MINNLGYDKLLFILPFDHRSSFTKGLFGVDEKTLTKTQFEKISELKAIIYEGFKQAVSNGTPPKKYAAILVDEKFGDSILKDALKLGFTTLLTTEKSGQKEFTFEYGEKFAEHIEKYKPTFAKALVRYNPEDNQELKTNQQKILKKLSDYCLDNNRKFLLEVLMPPTENQLRSVNDDKERYDKEIRPKLAVKIVEELHKVSIEPDVWKMEGMEKKEDYESLASAVRKGGRNNVGIVILGRDANKERVERWIIEGADVKGIIGFAVGRTVFWEPISQFSRDMITKTQAVEKISNNFFYFYNIFIKKKTIQKKLTYL